MKLQNIKQYIVYLLQTWPTKKQMKTSMNQIKLFKKNYTTIVKMSKET